LDGFKYRRGAFDDGNLVVHAANSVPNHTIKRWN
jgi:hypothetical protein